MASLNKFQGIGNLGRDPEVRAMPNGDKVASCSVAITERFKDRNGQQQEVTEWVNLVCYRRQAEILEQYVRKGSSIYFEGKLKTSSWEKEGQKHYKTEVVVSNFQMLGGKVGQTNNQAPSQAPAGDVPPYNDELPF
jgi:single-strand DNA-binding protein